MTRLHVTTFDRDDWIPQANAACCESAFCIFLGIFGHIQKKRVLFGETPKKEGLRVHVIRTLSFFRGKSDVF